MKTATRTKAASILVLASLCGCGTVVSVATTASSSVANLASHIFRPNSTDAPVAPPSPSLDAYKTQVAQHVVRHNASQAFNGRLPPMLPAIVVLNITVDKDGKMTDVVVQRSRDPDASRVAVASMHRSAPLPKPANLLARNSNSVTFSETFLFADAQYRFQLRSLAEPQ
jgi:protein TonB